MGLPQREGRPSLDLSPDANPSSGKQEFNSPMNELNGPVPERKGKPAPNGWQVEPYSVYPVSESESESD